MRVANSETGRFGLRACFLVALGVCLSVIGAGAQESKIYQAAEPPQDAVWLESLDLTLVEQGAGTPQIGHSVDGRPLTLRGTVYPHGVGTHAPSRIEVVLNGAALRFGALVGVDDEVGTKGLVAFEVWVDGVKKAGSSQLRGGGQTEPIEVDLQGAQRLLLLSTDQDGKDFDHSDWAGAYIQAVPGGKEKIKGLVIEPGPVPAIASGDGPEPVMNGPRAVGATPGREFIFLIPATGQGPLRYAAKGLPAGLKLDPKTGIIRGQLEKPGETRVKLTVIGPKGKAQRMLTIIGGEHKLCQTPPMGWNSWNVWGLSVSADKVREAADAMVKSGLAAHGFQYVNIDDGWEAGRDERGRILVNKKFGDMKALADYVHSKGLKLGIYSSPGPKTCGTFEGSYGHEQLDALSYAQWGIDYLKYDWCYYATIAKDNSLPELQKPYFLMRKMLDESGRDIVYSLCQYGMGDVWKWGPEVGGNLWRTTGDINDSWSSMASIGFDSNGPAEYAGPGHWNDPDMLVVGRVGWGPSIRPSRLAPNEQITHITLWCMQSSPLMIGCDMTQLDKFTTDLLTNDEVLAVNQDPLGKQARRIAQTDKLEVWARPLWDGTQAVALFNRRPVKAAVSAKWADLGLTGAQPVRDLWLRKDLGTLSDSFSTVVPAHGAVMLKVGQPKADQ